MDGAKISFSHMVKARCFFQPSPPPPPPGNLVVAPLFIDENILMMIFIQYFNCILMK